MVILYLITKCYSSLVKILFLKGGKAFARVWAVGEIGWASSKSINSQLQDELGLRISCIKWRPQSIAQYGITEICWEENLNVFTQKNGTNTTISPLSSGNTFQDLQWMPEATDAIKSDVYYVFY